MIKVSRESGHELLGYVVMSKLGQLYFKSIVAPTFNEGDSIIAFVVRIDSYNGYYDCSMMNFHGKLIGDEFAELADDYELPAFVSESIAREFALRILED